MNGNELSGFEPMGVIGDEQPSSPLGIESRSDLTALMRGDRIRFRGTRSTIIGTSRNDVLDVSKGQGRNVVRGLQGNDVLRARTQDKLLGGSGDDRLTVWKRDRAFGNRGKTSSRPGAKRGGIPSKAGAGAIC